MDADLETPSSPEDFKAFLQRELIRRCKSNPRYSLRAFARTLKLDSSYLSKVLQGRRSVTEGLIERVRDALALSPAQVETFKQRIPKPAKQGSVPVIPFDQVALDTFHLISDWYHFAILELTTIQGFSPNTKWIAGALDLPVPLVQSAVDRLARLGMLTFSEDGTSFRSSGNHTTVGNPFTASAFRKLQKDVLELALRALEEVPLDRRDQSSITLAIDSTRLAEAKVRIQQFRREITGFLNTSSDLDSVYHLTVSLYPVTKSDLVERNER